MTDLYRSIWIDAPLAVVHSYFTDAEKMSAWSGRSARLDPRPGGVYELDMGAGGLLSGTFVVVEPHRIEQRIDAPDGGEASRIRIEFSEEAGGTRVEVLHSGLPPPFELLAGRGWDHHLARLSVAATGGDPGPDSLCDRAMETLL